MNILGINITHDGTLSILKNGIHFFSIAEERINRKKAYIGFPFQALNYIIENKIILPSEIDLVTVSSNVFKKEWAFTYAFQLNENKKYYDLQNEKKPNDFFIEDKLYKKINTDLDCKNYVYSKIKKILESHKIYSEIEFIDHHLSHSASAYFSSGFRNALSITMDGEGDLLSATVSLCQNGKIERISSTSWQNSAGYLYSEVTKRCGYKMSRHEGKITGLAAYGNYKKYEKKFDSITHVDRGKLVINNLIKRTLLNKITNKLSMIFFKKPFLMGAEEVISRFNDLSNEDLSSSIQNHLEKRIKEIVEYWINKTKCCNVVLSGGVFANVKINQKISEINNLKRLFIFPDMGDGGNAYGSAVYTFYKKHDFKLDKSKIKNVYLGPSYKKNYVSKFLEKYSNKIDYFLSKNVSKETAKLLSKGKVIGWFQGRMEYGPRALGNRSILASATDRKINKWLNDKMHRTEFMPFAPSCLEEFATELFEIENQSLIFPANFMTITFNMKQNWVNKAPAVAHIDHTARPQLVNKKTNPKYYKLIYEYYKITGLPLIINTSFNVHEEPIVCKPEEGLKALLDSVIDVFVCEDYICFLKK